MIQVQFASSTWRVWNMASYSCFLKWRIQKQNSLNSSMSENGVLQMIHHLHCSYMMKETCDLIPQMLAAHHGFHWECYKRFTVNLDRLQPIASTSQAGNSSSQHTSRRISSDKILFNPDCIFCGSENLKKVKVKGSWTSQGMSQFEFDGWKSVLDMAKQKQDEKLLKRIRGYNLFFVK